MRAAHSKSNCRLAERRAVDVRDGHRSQAAPWTGTQLVAIIATPALHRAGGKKRTTVRLA
jgi:hypothetical protein